MKLVKESTKAQQAATMALLRWILVTVMAGQGLCKSNSSSSSECPIDFSYVQQMPWDKSFCLDRASSTDAAGLNNCCQTLLSLLGVGISEYLRASSRFELPNITAASDCISDFAADLHRTSRARLNWTSLVGACFPNVSRFVSSPDLCAGIQTLADWRRVMAGASTPDTDVDAACSGDLAEYPRCSDCTATARRAVGYLLRPLYAGNDSGRATTSKCFKFVIIYAAGIASPLGPRSAAVANCVLRVPLLPARNRRRFAVYGLITTSAAVAAVAALALGTALCRRRSAYRHLRRPKIGAAWYDLDELHRATGGFSKGNVVGHGGFGAVYLGKLPEGRAVAVKRIYGDAAGLMNEAAVLNGVRHRNLVQLRGYCVTGAGQNDEEEEQQELYLVYDYFRNGSLDQHIFGAGGAAPLTWAQRREIILGTARGLCYLHDGVRPAILHRDIKPTNILLDDAMQARLTDFGLARTMGLASEYAESGGGGGGGSSSGYVSTTTTTQVAGTFGYVAPEYALYGHLTHRSDVYSFGVVVLEILSGRRALLTPEEAPSSPAVPASDRLITDWAWRLLKAGRCRDILEERLRAGACEAEMADMERFVRVGILCSHVMVAFRPSMARALLLLVQGDLPVPDIPERPVLVTVDVDAVLLDGHSRQSL